MGDLEALVPQKTPTVLAIFDHHKRQGDAEPQRGYLGASIVGHECDRFLWLTFRGALREEKEGRIYRLLETGDLAEERFIRELRAIGAEVFDRDEKGEQFAVSALGGHFSGHADGVATGLPEAPKTPHLVETKTAKAEQFRKIAREGVKKAKPQHYAQMQSYMGLMELSRALYLVVNKDDDDLYGERVEFDRPFFQHLLSRAKRIVESSQAPAKVAKRADDYRCKFCPGQALCWGGDVAVPVKGGQTCRTCCHATADTEKGGWTCAKFGAPIEDTDVGAECPGHLLLPGFVSFAEPTDADADWIEFTNLDGTKWRLGPEPGQWTLRQLMTSRGPLDAPKAEEAEGQAVAEAALLTINFDDLPLLARYPWQDSERLWSGRGEGLEGAIWNVIGCEPDALPEPRAVHNDDLVSASEHVLPGIGDLLIVHYKAEDAAAIWLGKE